MITKVLMSNYEIDMKFTFLANNLNETTIQYRIELDDALLSYEQIVELMIGDNDFKDQLTETLKSVAFEGFFWEVRPVALNTLSMPFEFVVVNGSMLPRLTADPSHFQEYFRSDEAIVSFKNLGGDAKLVVPTNHNNTTNYAHLAGFLRTGSKAQINAFWTQIGLNFQELVNEQTLWLSTAGLGVHWLHVRFDQRPKYYRHQPYRTSSPN